MNTIVKTSLFALLALLLSGCTALESDPAPALLVAPDDGTDPVGVTTGEALEQPTEDRTAITAILKGSVATGDQPYAAELLKVFDSPVYRDLDATDDGADQWITRAQVLDAEGNLLWQDRINSMFQLIEYLGVILKETAVVELNTFQIFTFVNRDYPALLDFPVRVPTGIDGGVTYRLMVPDLDGELYEAFSAPIDDLVAAAEPPSLGGEIVELVESGPPEDRLDVVILGDGYIESSRGKFIGDAQAVADRLLATPPFDAHADMINVRAVWTPSAERGASYDCTGDPLLDRLCKDGFKDTVYGTVFVLTALADQLNLDLGNLSDRAALPVEIAKLYEAAAPAQYDEIILISNTARRSGFAGMYGSIVTAFDPREDFPDVAVHELGHSFALLGDEYQVSGDPCLYNEPRIPLPVNIAENVGRDELKWASWVDEAAPLPTPDAQRDLYDVGAFEGAYNCDFLYRPAHSCKMLTSTDEFCAVCSEQVSRRFFAYVDPVRAEPATATAQSDGTILFKVPLFDDMKARWLLNDEVVGEGPSHTVLPGAVGEGVLEAVIEENRGFIRDRQSRETARVAWQLATAE